MVGVVGQDDSSTNRVSPFVGVSAVAVAILVSATATACGKSESQVRGGRGGRTLLPPRSRPRRAPRLLLFAAFVVRGLAHEASGAAAAGAGAAVSGG